MNQGYTTLDKVVREACMELDDSTLSNYPKFLLWAMECLQDLRIDNFQEIKSILVTSSNLATVPFPTDMVKWTKIGEVSGDRVKVYTVNNSIMFNHKLECGEEQPNNVYKANDLIGPIENEDNSGYWFNNFNNAGGIYGYGNGTQGAGQFRENKDMREFQFSAQYANKDMVLEYVSTGLNPGGESYLEESIRSAVKEYIFWMNTERSKTAGLAEKQRAKELYDMKERIANRRNLIDMDSLLSAVRRSYKQTPRA